MIKVYKQNKLIILSLILLIALLSAFAFPVESFARNFLFGLAAGTAIAGFVNISTKKISNQ